jgi:SNF2 family DNA or RNA helicase
MIRRTRREVGRELPPLTKIPHHVDHNETALEEAAKSMTELAKFFLAKAGNRFDRMKAGGEIDWRLRQATGVAKAPYVADFVKVLCESGEKVLLYGWHHEVYGIWQERLKDYHPVFYTGQESPTQKNASKEAFCNGKSRVLIMSLRAGAGLDGLQHHCRTTVFGELDWSPGVHEQCIGRPFRDGQQDPVTAYFMISNAGSDPVIADVLGIKKGQIDGVMNPDADLFEPPAEAPEDGIKRLAEEILRRQGIDPERT